MALNATTITRNKPPTFQLNMPINEAVEQDFSFDEGSIGAPTPHGIPPAEQSIIEETKEVEVAEIQEEQKSSQDGNGGQDNQA